MARPLSQDLRERIIKARQEGKSFRAIAAQFCVAVKTAFTVVKYFFHPETIPEKSKPGPISKLEAHKDFIHTMIKEKNDITLEEIRRKLYEENRVGKVGISTLFQFLKKCGYTYKKNSSPQRAKAS